MKITAYIAVFIAALSFASCSSISNSASSNTAAKTAGTSCGKVLSGLYSQYKSSGKLNMASSSTLTNVIELGACYKLLKDNRGNSAYRKSFAAGLVSGSNGLITNSKASSVISSLLSITGLGNVTSSTSSSSSVLTGIATNLINIFTSLKNSKQSSRIK